MSRIENKLQRLEEIEAILLAHPEGQTQSQLADRLGVHRSTVMRNLIDLSAPVYEEDGRFFIDREAYLVNLKLNLHEALAIHLAGRMMSARLDRRNPHIAGALRKLGIAVKNLAPAIGDHLCLSADCFDNQSKVDDPLFLQVLEKLTIAWAEQCEVELWYRKPDSVESKKYIFRPFFIEPGAVGQTIYSIGQISPEYEVRTFKLERILRIELTQNHFELPDDFDAGHLFDQAWGIWFTDQEPVEVQLKFSQRVAQRVRETRWHPSEQVSICEDGSLLWQAFIAEPREMMPWIRGWGSDVEVLMPLNIREEMVEEAHRIAALYGGSNG
jgi:predicted DNA-binding transcriptional regulator YafY